MDNTRMGELTLEIRGKKVKLVFGMLFWKFLGEKGIKMHNLDQKLGSVEPLEVFDTISKIIHSAGWVAAKKADKEFEYSEDDVFEWFEEDITEEMIKSIVETMLQSKILGKSLNDGLKRGKKKPNQVKKS